MDLLPAFCLVFSLLVVLLVSFLYFLDRHKKRKVFWDIIGVILGTVGIIASLLPVGQETSITWLALQNHLFWFSVGGLFLITILTDRRIIDAYGIEFLSFHLSVIMFISGIIKGVRGLLTGRFFNYKVWGYVYGREAKLLSWVLIIYGIVFPLLWYFKGKPREYVEDAEQVRIMRILDAGFYYVVAFILIEQTLLFPFLARHFITKNISPWFYIS